MYPLVFAAGLIALYFMVMTLKPPRAAKILGAVLWAAYAVYEYHIANGTLCDADCNIRVDIVLFIPLLGCAAYLAIQKEPRIGAVLLLYVICLGLAAWLLVLFGYTAAAVIAGISAVAAAVLGVRSMFSAPRA